MSIEVLNESGFEVDEVERAAAGRGDDRHGRGHRLLDRALPPYRWSASLRRGGSAAGAAATDQLVGSGSGARA